MCTKNAGQVAGAGALAYRAWRQHDNARALAIDSPNGIQEARFVEIGGIEQWVQIRGRDRANPVVLILAGGPGNSLVPLTPVFQAWEHAFTVVQWDQRGAGKTYGRNGIDEGPMTIDRMRRDGIELTRYLLQHLEQEKLVLLGHSWCTVLGVPMVKSRPDLYSAYIGTGQVVAKEEKEEILYASLMEEVRAAHDEDDLSALEAIGAPPYETQEELLVEREVSERYDTPAERHLESDMTPVVLFAPDYSLLDIRALLAGSKFAGDTMYREILGYDTRSLGARFDVPFFVFNGDHDRVTPAPLARDYFETIEAPHKEFVVLEGGGHSALLTMPDVFLAKLVARVRPLVAAGSDRERANRGALARSRQELVESGQESFHVLVLKIAHRGDPEDLVLQRPLSGVDHEAALLQPVVKLAVADAFRQTEGADHRRSITFREQRLDAEPCEPQLHDAGELRIARASCVHSTGFLELVQRLLEREEDVHRRREGRRAAALRVSVAEEIEIEARRVALACIEQIAPGEHERNAGRSVQALVRSRGQRDQVPFLEEQLFCPEARDCIEKQGAPRASAELAQRRDVVEPTAARFVVDGEDVGHVVVGLDRARDALDVDGLEPARTDDEGPLAGRVEHRRHSLAVDAVRGHERPARPRREALQHSFDGSGSRSGKTDRLVAGRRCGIDAREAPSHVSKQHRELRFAVTQVFTRQGRPNAVAEGDRPRVQENRGSRHRTPTRWARRRCATSRGGIVGRGGTRSTPARIGA